MINLKELGRVTVAALIVEILFYIFVGLAMASDLKASYYSTESLKKEGTFKLSKGIMANGQRFDDKAMTCATRIYPLGSWVEVKNISNGKKVVVKVTDRIGKRFARSRIDLSKSAFKKIAELKTGIVPIKVRRIKWQKS